MKKSKNTTQPPDDLPPPSGPSEPSHAPRRTKGVVARKDGRQLRRMTIYLPPELARRLAIHAAGDDVDVSSALAEIVRNFLENKTP